MSKKDQQGAREPRHGAKSQGHAEAIEQRSDRHYEGKHRADGTGQTAPHRARPDASRAGGNSGVN